MAPNHQSCAPTMTVSTTTVVTDNCHVFRSISLQDEKFSQATCEGHDTDLCGDESSLLSRTNWRTTLDEEYLRFFAVQRTLFQNAIRGIDQGPPGGGFPRIVILSGTAETPKHQLGLSILQHKQKEGDAPAESATLLEGGSGKFHHTTSCLPYHTILMAMDEWMFSLVSTLSSSTVSENKDTAERVRKAIQCALDGDELDVLVPHIPHLAKLMKLGTCDRPPSKNVHDRPTCATLCSFSDKSLSPNGNQQRFVLAFCHLMRVIAAEARPFALVLDDVHVADAGSLDLLATIVTDQLPQHDFTGDDFESAAEVCSGAADTGLVVVATCDASAVAPDSHLAVKLREMEAAGVGIQNFALPTPSKDDLENILARTFGESKLGWVNDTWLEIVQATMSINGGMEEVVTLMTEIDAVGRDNKAGMEKLMETKLVELSLKDDSASVETISKAIGKRQTASVVNQEDFIHVLKVAACFGFFVDVSVVAQVANMPIDHVVDVLDEAVDNGILKWASLPKTYSFSNNTMYDMVYRKIPVSKRKSFHLDLGFSLWAKSIENNDVDQNMFLILSQVYQGRECIAQTGQEIVVATLCLKAGQEAARLSAFRKAIEYLNFGIGLLPIRTWRDHYELSLGLFSAAAELELFQGRFDEMEAKLEVVFANARTVGDAIVAHGTRLVSLSMRDKQIQALDVGIELLKQIGEPMPTRMILLRVIMEIQAIEKLLKGKTDEDLLNLPPVSDPNKLHAMTILQFMIYPGVSARPDLGSFILVRTFRMTLQHGLSQFAAHAFLLFGMVLRAMGDIERANRFAHLGSSIWEKSKIMEYLPRLTTGKHGCIYNWSRPLRDGLGPLFQGYKVGAQLGDFEFACLCGVLFIFQAFDAGVPLDKALKNWNQIENTIIAFRQETLLLLSRAGVQCVHHLMGLTEDPLSPVGDLVDFDHLEKEFAKSEIKTHMTNLRFNRMRLGYMFGDYDMAEKHAVTVEEALMHPPSAEHGQLLFFLGMLCAARAKRRGLLCGQRLSTIKRVIRLFQNWTKHSATNFGHRLHLLKAELAAVQGKLARAQEHYSSAIEQAGKSRSHFMTGICNERMAKYQARCGKLNEAKHFFVEALDAYGKWAAYGKQRHLQEEAEAICGIRF